MNTEALAECGLAAAVLKTEGRRETVCGFKPHSFRQTLIVAWFAS